MIKRFWLAAAALLASGVAAQAQTPPAGGETPKRGEIVVVGSTLEEERAVGPYNKPEYIEHRRFTTTRVYLQTDPGEVEFEQWVEIRQPKNPHETSVVRLSEEFEFGLAEHFQLDLYLSPVQDRNGVNSTVDFREMSAELRYAPWKWNEVFGNPTLYFEYVLCNNAADGIEPKLLLGGELGAGLHWGLNLVYERELANRNDADEEYKVTAGLSYTLIDKTLSVGPELMLAYSAERTTEAGVNEVERSREVHFGPSLQWRPLPKAHVDIVPLFGCTGESKRLDMYMVFGWKF